MNPEREKLGEVPLLTPEGVKGLLLEKAKPILTPRRVSSIFRPRKIELIEDLNSSEALRRGAELFGKELGCDLSSQPGYHHDTERVKGVLYAIARAFYPANIEGVFLVYTNWFECERCEECWVFERRYVPTFGRFLRKSLSVERKSLIVERIAPLVERVLFP